MLYCQYHCSLNVSRCRMLINSHTSTCLWHNPFVVAWQILTDSPTACAAWNYLVSPLPPHRACAAACHPSPLLQFSPFPSFGWNCVAECLVVLALWHNAVVLRHLLFGVCVCVCVWLCMWKTSAVGAMENFCCCSFSTKHWRESIFFF